MERHFQVEQNHHMLTIKDISSFPLCEYWIYINDQLAASFHSGKTFYVSYKHSDRKQHLLIIAAYVVNGKSTRISEQFIFYPYQVGFRDPDRNFRAGDILVASDNLNQTLTGYVGHSALVIDENNLIESPGGHPAIQKDSIQQFLDKHPVHAQFRPKSAEMGKGATNYAKDYLKKYRKNLEDGIKEPEFSFMATQKLEDQWTYIYCSKLIWLSYYNGADYELENDFLWYSPEDLFTGLQENDDFEMIYKHNDVEFQMDT